MSRSQLNQVFAAVFAMAMAVSGLTYRRVVNHPVLVKSGATAAAHGLAEKNSLVAALRKLLVEKSVEIYLVVVVCSTMLVGKTALVGELVETGVLERTDFLYESVVKQIWHTLVDIIPRPTYLHRDIDSQIATLMQLVQYHEIRLSELHFLANFDCHCYDTVGKEPINKCRFVNAAIEPAVILSDTYSLTGVGSAPFRV